MSNLLLRLQSRLIGSLISVHVSKFFTLGRKMDSTLNGVEPGAAVLKKKIEKKRANSLAPNNNYRMVWIERDFKDHLVPGPLLGAANKNKIMVFPQNPNKVSCKMQFYVFVGFFKFLFKRLW